MFSTNGEVYSSPHFAVPARNFVLVATATTLQILKPLPLAVPLPCLFFPCVSPALHEAAAAVTESSNNPSNGSNYGC